MSNLDEVFSRAEQPFDANNFVHYYKVKPERRMKKYPLIPTNLTMDEWQDLFEKKIKEDPTVHQPLVVLHMYREFIERDDSTTMQEFLGRSYYVRFSLRNSPSAGVTVSSSAKLFIKMLTRQAEETEEARPMSNVRIMLNSRLNDLVRLTYQAPDRIAKYIEPTFTRFDCMFRVAVCGWDDTVAKVLIHGYKANPIFSVAIQECYPYKSGLRMAKTLRDAGVPVEVFPDHTLNITIKRCEFVLAHVEAINVNGDIQCNVYTTGMIQMANQNNIDVHVIAEYYKLVCLSRMPQTLKYNELCYNLSREIKENEDYSLKLNEGKPALNILTKSTFRTLTLDDGCIAVDALPMHHHHAFT